MSPIADVRSWLRAAVALTGVGLLWLCLRCVAPEWVDGRYRAYRSFYSAVEVGMTRAEVLAAMRAVYPEAGPRRQPTILVDDATDLAFFMHPESASGPNCEGIFLRMREGRVVAASYAAD